MDELPVELLQLVILFKADAILDLAAGDELALQLRSPGQTSSGGTRLSSQRLASSADG